MITQSTGLKGSTNIWSKWQVRNSRNSEIPPSTFPSPLHPSALGAAGLAEPQIKQRNKQQNIHKNNRIFTTGISKDPLQVLKMGVEKTKQKSTALGFSSVPLVTGELRPKRATREEFPYSPNLQELHFFHPLKAFPSLTSPFP